MRILIVKLSAFGDIVHAIPAVNNIHKAIPHAELFWVVDSQFQELLKGLSALSGIIPLPIKELKKQKDYHILKEGLRAAWEMKERNFDTCIDIQGNIKSGVISYLSGADACFGFARNGVRERGNLLFTNRKISLHNEDTHIFQKSMRVIHGALGIPMEREPGFPAVTPDAEALGRVREKIPLHEEGAGIAIHHGTTWETKKLSTEKWSRMIDGAFSRFGEKKIQFYLTWGNRDELEAAEAIAYRLTGRRKRLAIIPGLSIGELAAFYSLMDLVVGPDTGPLHLAAAVGAKTLSFYRATKGTRNAPQGSRHRFLQAEVDCTACLKKSCRDSHLCEESLNVDDFINYMGELLEGRLED